MKTLWMTSIAMMALLTSGCGKLISVEPLATTGTVVFDPTLLGAWNDEDDSIYTVREGAEQSYEIDCVLKDSKDETIALTGRLVQLGDQRVLDLSARKGAPFSVTGHAFLRVSHVPEGLEVRFLGTDWLQEQIVRANSPAHFMYENHPVITAPTADLQAFLLTFGLTEAAQDEPSVLKRTTR